MLLPIRAYSASGEREREKKRYRSDRENRCNEKEEKSGGKYQQQEAGKKCNMQRAALLINTSACLCVCNFSVVV